MATEDDRLAPMYVVNHDAMYWRARALEAERERDELRQKLDEAIETGCRFADTSSQTLLTAICAGAFDGVRAKEPSE